MHVIRLMAMKEADHRIYVKHSLMLIYTAEFELEP